MGDLEFEGGEEGSLGGSARQISTSPQINRDTKTNTEAESTNFPSF